VATKQEPGTLGHTGVASRARRAPVQKRSVAKVERILEAAQQLAEEFPPAEITTNLIAGRAKVSVGSLYGYFPDKAAVFTAVTTRYVEHFAELLRKVFEDPAPSDWAAASDAVIDAFTDYYRTEPGFRALWFGGYRSDEVAELDRSNLIVLADLWRSLLVQHGLIQDDPALDLPFEISWELGDRLLDLAFRRDPNGDERVIAEAKVILRYYEARYLGKR